jgi:hypothetical protein
MLSWAVRMTGDLEANIVSIERIDEYSKTPVEVTKIKQKKIKTHAGAMEIETIQEATATMAS